MEGEREETSETSSWSGHPSQILKAVCQSGRGEDGGRARLLVLAEPSGKETVDGLWACAVGQIVKRQIPRKPGAPYMAEEDRGKEHSGNNFKISIIK